MRARRRRDGRLRSAKAIAYIGTNLSPALLGVGYIVGLNIGIVIVAGSMLSWNIAIPIYSAFFLDASVLGRAIAAQARRCADAIWGTQIRYLGVGAMLVGGIWTLFSLRNSLLSGVRSGLAATRAGAAKVIEETEQDHADEGGADRARRVHAAARRAVPGDRATTSPSRSR